MGQKLSAILRCWSSEPEPEQEPEPEPEQEPEQKPEQESEYAVIAALDFGTSSSGYAFVFTKSSSDSIKLAAIQLNKWQLESASSSTEKAPTTVLLRPDKVFESFGCKAEDKYVKLCDTRRQKGWWFFQKFKMVLYKEKLSREEVLEDAEGKTMPAKALLSIVIGHLKDCVLEDIKSQNSNIKDYEILYVLTVPSIWSEAAKQFMREAATDSSVGIKDNQLRLVLEPEAASVYCRQRKSRVVRNREGITTLESLECGHKYIILDIGGGTADITTHEIIENGQLLEIDYARGDNLGGQTFNENFFQFLCEIFGYDILREWRNNKQGDYLRLQRAIEGIKWDIADNDEEVFFKFPYSLVKHFKNVSGKTVQETVFQSEFRDHVEVVEDDQFLISSSLMKGFFENTLSGVTQYISSICKATSEIETVIMVGGLAKSTYVVKYIETKFPKYTLIVPENPGVAVLKGAVMLGNKPNTITGRIARYSYGIGDNDYVTVGEYDNHKLVGKGQLLKYGDTFTKTATVFKTNQDIVVIDLYQSTSENPSNFTEQCCTKCGSIKVSSRKKLWPYETHLNVQIIVEEAQFEFRVTDSVGGRYNIKVDYLAQKATSH